MCGGIISVVDLYIEFGSGSRDILSILKKTILIFFNYKKIIAP